MISKDSEKLRKASDIFMKMACLYDELAKLNDAEETKENEDKLTMLVGKLMITMGEMQRLDM